MKKILLLSLSLLLIGCGDITASTNSSYVYDEAFSRHLSELLSFNDSDITYQEDYVFNLDYYLSQTETDDGTIVVLEFSYKNIFIEDIKIIALPLLTTSENVPSNICNIGYYDDKFCVGEELDIANNIYKGIRLMYKTYSDNEDVKILFNGLVNNQEVSYKFCIDYESFDDLNNEITEEKNDNNVE